jgi:hypothetical protein
MGKVMYAVILSPADIASSMYGPFQSVQEAEDWLLYDCELTKMVSPEADRETRLQDLAEGEVGIWIGPLGREFQWDESNRVVDYNRYGYGRPDGEYWNPDNKGCYLTVIHPER